MGRRDTDELGSAALAPAPPATFHHMRKTPGPVVSNDAAEQTSDHRPGSLYSTCLAGGIFALAKVRNKRAFAMDGSRPAAE